MATCVGDLGLEKALHECQVLSARCASIFLLRSHRDQLTDYYIQKDVALE